MQNSINSLDSKFDKIEYIDDSSNECNEFNKFLIDPKLYFNSKESIRQEKIYEKSHDVEFNREFSVLPYSFRRACRTKSLNSNGPDTKDKNNNLDKKVCINVGGVRFETYKETLKLISESRLANLSKTNSDYDPIKNEYFFDRDPDSFSSILNFYRSGKLHAPLNVCGNQFYEELCFWGIGERSIEACCWTNYSIKRDCDEILKQVMEEVDDEIDYYSDSNEDNVPSFSNITNKDSVIRFPRENKKNWLFKALKKYFSRIRPPIWKFLDDRGSSSGAKIFFWISVVFLVTSLINFVLETSPIGRIPYEISSNKSMSRRERDALTVPDPKLLRIELICNIFFTIEYVLRFISSPDKHKFLTNLYSWLEFLAISPVFWPAETISNKNSWGVKIHNYIEVFYILRILRIFTLVPKTSGLRVLLLSLRKSIGELVLYMVMLVMTLLIFASFIFYAEQIFEEEDNKFDSILIALWWAIVTMTTLGYGDIVPVTPFGYIIGGMCALCGLLFLALPIPVIVNNFTTFYAHAKAREKLKEYSEIHKNLPNRAIAIHFHSNDMKNVRNSSISNLYKETRNSKTELKDINNNNTSYNNFEKLNRDILNEKENEKIIDPGFFNKFNLPNSQVKSIKDTRSLSNDAKVLEKWRRSKRRTIRRSALVDFKNFDNSSISRSRYSLNSNNFYV